MKRRQWRTVVWIVVLLMLPFAALCEQDDGAKGIVLEDIEILINGVPVEEVIGAASDMFADSLEQNMGEAIQGFNSILDAFASDLSNDLKEIETVVGSMIEERWLLNIQPVAFNAFIRRTACSNALELYQAQISGETDKSGRIAKDCAQGGHSIVYLFDEGTLMNDIMNAVHQDEFGQGELIFGLEGYTGNYQVVAVAKTPASAEPDALCNMTDLSDEEQFETFRDQIAAGLVKEFDGPLECGDSVLTIIIWNQETASEWLAVIAREVPMLLE